MHTGPPHVAATFFAATRALACHTGSLQQRLADAYAGHLLQVVSGDLPPELQPIFRELEDCMNAVDEQDAEDPFTAAALKLSDAEAQGSIDRIVALFGRLAGLGA